MIKMQLLVSLLLQSVCLLCAGPLTSSSSRTEPGHFTNSFLVDADPDVISAIARDYGFVLEDEQHWSPLGLYHLVHPSVAHRSKRSAEDHVNNLLNDPRVKYAEQEVVLNRKKREIIHDKQQELPVREIIEPSKFYRVPVESLRKRTWVGGADEGMDFSDPYYKDSWYLHNEGQTGGKEGVDLRVSRAWKSDFTGKGIRVLVLDDGLDHTHPDLRDNFDKEISADFNSNDNDPMPDVSTPENSHGTRCAGEIAGKAGNDVCSVGVAYNSKVGGIRILDGDVTDRLEARALNHQMDKVDIYSASWGPLDDGRHMEGPKEATRRALERGAKEGRNGKGSVFVWATGNGGANYDSCGADGYVSSRYTMSVGSLNEDGDTPYFMEKCSSTLAVVASGGEKFPGQDRQHEGARIKVVTPDINGGCVLDFQGTSSAAPLAAGIFALTLEANPDLTWRDLQHMVAATARLPKVSPQSWYVNAAGIHFSDDIGFGLMDAAVMIYTAQNWGKIPDQNVAETSEIQVNKELHPSQCVEEKIDMSKFQDDPNTKINFLEHVNVHVKMTHSRRGNVKIIVTAPSNTKSTLLFPRQRDTTSSGIDFEFSSVHFWGEDLDGEWTVTICDIAQDGNSGNGTVQSLVLKAYGIPLDKGTRSTKTTPYQATEKEQAEIIAKETKIYHEAKIKKRSLTTRKNLRQKSQKGEISETELAAILDEVQGDLSKKGFVQEHIDRAKAKGRAIYASNYKRNFGEHQSFLENKWMNPSLDQSARGYEDTDDVVGDLLDVVEEIVEEKRSKDRTVMGKRTEDYLNENRWGDRNSYKISVSDLADKIRSKINHL